MRLRSITKHVRDQNWFAVFLDFFIVVIGVFIGLQVANWSDERGDRSRETQILQEIAADIQSDRVGYSSALNNALNRITAATYVLEHVPDTKLRMMQDEPLFIEDMAEGMGYNDALETNQQLRDVSFTERENILKHQLWSGIWIVDNVEPSTTAFDSLVNSGELSILQNESLVRNLQQYRKNTAGIGKAQDFTFRPARDNGIEIGQKFGLSAFGSIDEGAFIELVSSNAHLAAAIQTQLGWSKGHFVGLTLTDNHAAQLLKQIEDELGASLKDTTTKTNP